MRQMALDIGLATEPRLSNFVAGPNEQALQQVAEWVDGALQEAQTAPVPTYLWGEGGSGKTHLLKSAYHALRDQGLRVAWLDASVQSAWDFDAGWSAVILDDVHLYTPAQQHMAFAWFVGAQTHACPVLAAGASVPAALTLREDLRTRLGWGHVLQLQLLSEADRRAVLRHAADERGVFLSDEVMDYMLTRFSRDLGSLMELLDSLDDYALQTQRNITVPLIRSMMENT